MRQGENFTHNAKMSYSKTIPMESSGEITQNHSSKKEAIDASEIVISEIVVNNAPVKLVGVYHSKEFLDQHHDDLEKLVHESGLVIPEGAPFADESPFLESEIGYAFFKGIADMAQETPGKITVVDPMSSNNFNLVSGVLEGASLGTMLAALGIRRQQKQEDTSREPDESEESSQRTKPERSITRRGLLKAGLGAGLSYSLMRHGLVSGIATDMVVGKEATHSFGGDDILSYTAFDYRNISIATAINQITKERGDEFTKDAPLTIIYGAAHPGPVIGYLRDHLTVRTLKEALYKPGPFSLSANRRIKNYEYVDNQWSLKSTQPY